MSVESASPAPVQIPIPPDFPVTWEHADEARLFWTQDKMHNPDQVPPLEADFWPRVWGGFARGTESYGLPLQPHARCINTYMYMAIAPSAPPDQMEELGKRAQERLHEAMSRLEVLWNDTWLPEIHSHLAWWTAFDLSNASMSDLVAHLRETLKRVDRLWELHFQIVLPAYVAISQFDELHRELFGADGAFGAYRLLQGFDNKTVETGRTLWALSQKAGGMPEVRSILESANPDEVMSRLGETAAGRVFRDELRQYLETYGQRGDKWGLGYPSWIENPAPVIRNLRDYIARTDRDANAERAHLIEERERALADARAALKGYPQAVVDRFEFLLKAAQFGNVLTEDHGFWIDFNSTYRVRLVLLEFGRRLAAAKAIDSLEDLFYLTVNELLEGDAALRSDFRPRVAERRAVVERFSKVSPPPVLGTDYGPPPDNPIGRFVGKFFGGPPPVSDAPDVLKGYAGSPGKVRGTARVIRMLDEADRLKRGDILVAETTAPPWTPLFATAGGIVTDTGGILSHCAVVAREYRIPAVVGMGRATAVIKDGQILEVDGDAGTVRILGA